MTGLLNWAGIWLATSMVTVPTPPGMPSTDVTAHHGLIYQTSNAGDATQGFLDIVNTGAADELTGVACPLADTTSIVGPDGNPLTNLVIPPRQTLQLAAGGPHLLLQSTHFSVDYGGVVPCSLTFENAGTISVFLYATPAP